MKTRIQNQEKCNSIMSKLLALLVVSIGCASQTFATDIDSTLADCRRSWGHEVKTEPAWCGGIAYGFTNGKLYVYAIVGETGRIEDITYFATNWPLRKLTAGERDYFWKQNQGTKIFDNPDPWLYNAKRIYKKFGVEDGTHWVEYSWDGSKCLVANETKNLGWQIRSLKQFQAEQKIIKRLKNESFAEQKDDKALGEVRIAELSKIK
jgi:hypothetical protein